MQHLLLNNQIEDYIYIEIKKQFDNIKKYSNSFNVDLKLIVSLIFVERIQYKLDKVRDIAKKVIFKFEDIIKTFYNNDDIIAFFNSSKGFCHIKFGTARYLVRKYRDSNILTDLELGTYHENIEISIKFSCAIINEHILMWINKVPDIRSKIDILATLYNVSDFENKIPHNNPQSGGSILPIIIDGLYIENMCFGDRVKAVYYSKKMNEFTTDDKI